MAKIIFTFIITLISFFAFSQNDTEYSNLIKKANDCYKKKEFRLSVENYEQAFKISYDNTSDIYNAACSYALLGDQIKAIELLKTTINLGWDKVDHIQKDSDLFSLHCLSEWNDIISLIKVQNVKNRSKQLYIDKVTSLINRNNSNGLWELCNSNYVNEITKSDFSKKIDSIYKLLRKGKLNNFNFISNGTETSIQYINGKKIKYRKYKYFIRTNFFNGASNKFLTKSIGTDISIQISEDNNKEYLSNITISLNYFDNSFDYKEKIDALFNNQDSISYRVVIKKGQQFVISERTKTAFKPSLISLEPLFMLELSNLEISNYSDNQEFYKLCSISFISLNIENKHLFSANKKIKRIEFMFIENKSNIVLIATEENYGFFKVQSTNQLSRLASKEFENIIK